MRKQLNASRPQSRFCRIASTTAVHALVAAVLLSFPSRSSAQTLTRIDFPNALQTVPAGINAAGDIVGEYLDSNLVGHGFLLRRGLYTSIEVPGALSASVTGINWLATSWAVISMRPDRMATCCATARSRTSTCPARDPPSPPASIRLVRLSVSIRTPTGHTGLSTTTGCSPQLMHLAATASPW